MSKLKNVLKVSPINLAFCWTLFLTLGVRFGELSTEFEALHFGNFSNPGFVVPIIHFIVLISSLIFIQCEMQWGIWLLASLRGISYGFIIGYIFAYFGNSGWLICLMCCFANSICIIVELWYWFNLLMSNKKIVMKCALISFILELAVFLVDFFYFQSFTSVIIM